MKKYIIDGKYAVDLELIIAVSEIASKCVEIFFGDGYATHYFIIHFKDGTQIEISDDDKKKLSSLRQELVSQL